MSNALAVRSLHHVGRLTKHLEASRAFYREVLGFREIQRPNFNFGGAWLFNYGLQIHLIVDESIPDPSGPIQTRESHLAFMVEDLTEVERRLEKLGVAFRKNVVPERNTQQIFFRDPDGYHIEVGVYPPTIEMDDAPRKPS